MTPKRLIIYGTGTIAELVHFYFTTDSDLEVVAFSDQDSIVEQTPKFLGLPVLSWDQVQKDFNPSDVQIFVAIGYKKTNTIREKRFNQVLSDGYQCASYISSKAIVLTQSIGQNCLILEQNVVQPFVSVGDNVFLWSGNHIGHHSAIKDHSFLASHVVISGKCTVGHNSFLGVNTCLRDGVSLGEYSVVGSGSIVMSSCPARSVFVPVATEPRVIRRDII